MGDIISGQTALGQINPEHAGGVDSSNISCDPAFQGWSWSIKDLMVRASNQTDRKRICSVVLRAKDENDIEATINRAKDSIRKHHHEEYLKRHNES